MAKMRVHELSKELGVSSKDIINFLTERNIDAGSHMSTLNEDAVVLVRNKFTRNAPAKTVAPSNKEIPAGNGQKSESAGKSAGTKEAAQGKDGEVRRPKKKSTITAVYNSQYSKMGRDRGNGGRGQRRDGKRPYDRTERGDGRQDSRNARPMERKRIDITDPKSRPQGERLSQRVHRNDPEPVAETRKQSATETRQERPQETRQERTQETRQEHTQETRQERPQNVYQNVYQNDRQRRSQDGDRPRRSQDGERSGRPQGDRPSRYNDGERNRRSQGERTDRNHNGDRPQKRYGDRNGEQGERRNERKDFNHQKDNQSSRNGGNSYAGGRNDHSGNQGRSGAPKKDDRRVSRDAAPAATETRRDNRTAAAGKKKKPDYDRKNRKQENYINLEKKTGHKKRNAVPQASVEKKEDEVRTIILPEILTIRELADIIKIPPTEIIKKLFMQGVMMTVNQDIEYEKAEEIALEFNCIAEPEEKVDVIAELLKEDEEDEDDMVARPPVVCVMGHVDHGKTSLLDAIRNTRVTDKEAGGITQAIGASVVTINGQKITFLDTPGHEAFTAMRMRGANSTDIAILVVAADDGIMPQTVEAINHAKAAGVEILVAINKIDKEGANIERVKQGLTEYELVPEDWGGSTICVPVSAKTGEGIQQLLEMVLLSAEILELKADPKRNARGLVIEAQLDKGRGSVASVLVQKGTLKVGQAVACGSSYGRIRAMIDDKGRRVKEAGPSTPVEILGLNSVPNAGEVFVVCDSEKDARSFAETFVAQDKERLVAESRMRMSLDDLFSQIQNGDLKELNLIVKADVQGSVEAVKQSLLKLSNEEVVVKVIHGGVGAISESDVSLASASNAIIIGFNVKPDAVAKSTAEQEHIDIRLYDVIYKAIEDIELAMKGMLDPVFEEKIIGHAEVRQIFKASGVGNIAGSYVLDGIFERNCKIRITREGNQIYEGSLASLKRFKDDVKEVRAGYECGLVFDGFNDLQELDIVEAYKMVEVPR